MLADLDASLIAWLTRLLPDTTVTLQFPQPGEGPAPQPGTVRRGRKEGPATTLVLHLAAVRQDGSATEPGWADVRDSRGVVVGRAAPMRSYRVTYLVVPFGPDPLAEHEALGQLLAINEVVLADADLRGSLRELRREVMVHAAPENPGYDPRELWAVWGHQPRAVVELSVLAAMPTGAAAAVPEPPSAVGLGAARLPGTPPEPEVPVGRPQPPRRQISED